MFLRLDRNMGHQAFLRGFRNFHQRLSTYGEDGIDQGVSLKRAFCPSCQINASGLDKTGLTLARRFGGKVLTDTSEPAGAIPGLGVAVSTRIENNSASNRQYGFATLAPSGPDAQHWLQVMFADVQDPPYDVAVRVQHHHEDRDPWYDMTTHVAIYTNHDQTRAWFYIHIPVSIGGFRPAGHHWIYVYAENGEKIAEMEYQVVP